MDQDKIAQAEAMEKEARRLRFSAFSERRLPDFWREGQKVRYLNDRQWCWKKGETGVVIKVPKEFIGKLASEPQWFITSGGKWYPGRHHTTPSDVELMDNAD